MTITTREFLVADESTLVLTGNESIQATSLFVTNHSVITSKPQSHLGIDVPDLVIDQTSSISADRRGYPAEQVREPVSGWAVTHREGDMVVLAGQSLMHREVLVMVLPSAVDLGSGGASYEISGGEGGGSVRLNISGTLVIDGSVTANGGNGGGGISGGGSGGSIYITAENLQGSGYIRANGGDTGYQSGGGGGGRIAIYFRNSSFSGTSTVTGGTGWNLAVPAPLEKMEASF